MPTYTFNKEESIEDHVPTDEEVVDVNYSGDEETVETEKVDNNDQEDESEQEEGEEEAVTEEVDRIED